MKFSPSAAFLAFSVFCSAVFAAPTDDRFLAARDAYRNGDRAKLERLATELKGHDLDAYVEYWQLVGPDTVCA